MPGRKATKRGRSAEKNDAGNNKKPKAKKVSSKTKGSTTIKAKKPSKSKKDDDKYTNENDGVGVNRLEQPSTIDMTAIFDPSKVKAFLYKQEPNMARINRKSIELISTTTSIFLKSIVEQAVKHASLAASSTPQQESTKQNSTRKKAPPARQQASQNNPTLITMTHLKDVVSSNPSLEFLQESLDVVNDKDTNKHFGVSSLKEYTTKKKPTKKPTAKTDMKDPEQWKKVAKAIGSDLPDAIVKQTINNFSSSTGTAQISDTIIPDMDDYD